MPDPKRGEPKIQLLESHFGVPMFVRNSRNVRLTPEGEQVLATARNILAQLKTLEDRLAPQERPFRIRMHVSLAVRWLLPKLSEFYRSHPQVSLSIETVATEVVEPAIDSMPTSSICPSRPRSGVPDVVRGGVGAGVLARAGQHLPAVGAVEDL